MSDMTDTDQNQGNANMTGDSDHNEHPKPRYDDVNMPVVVLLGILSAILTFVIIVFVQGLYYSWENSLIQKDWASRVPTPQEKIIADQKEIRDGYFSAADGKVYIPVNAAMAKIVENGGEVPAMEIVEPGSKPAAPEKADVEKGASGKTEESKPKEKPVVDPPKATPKPAEPESRPEPPGPDASGSETPAGESSGSDDGKSDKPEPAPKKKDNPTADKKKDNNDNEEKK